MMLNNLEKYLYKREAMKSKFLIALAMCVLGVGGPVSAQSGLGSLFDTGASEQDGVKKPTLIDAENMDMDIQKNIAIFVGKVVVDSAKLHITCERMELFMEDVVVEGKKKKQLREIHCFKNRKGDLEANDPTDKRVVIVRQLPEQEVAEKGEQRSFSGKAVYNVQTGEIVLTDEPIMVQGINEIHGSKITIWRDTDVMNVVNGHIRYIDPEEK